MKTYESKRQLADRYGISVSTVENLLRRIRDLIGDRYPRDAVTHCGLGSDRNYHILQGGLRKWTKRRM